MSLGAAEVPMLRYKRSLVFRGGALGDFLLTLPALQALEIEHLTLVTRSSYSALLQACGWKHQFVNLECAQVAELFRATEPRETAWLQGFDHIYAWMTDDDGYFQRNLRTLSTGNITLLNPLVSGLGKHASRQLATELPIKIGPIRWPKLPVIKLAPQRIAVHPGSGSSTKNWPVEHWLALMHKWMSADATVSFLIIAGEADELVLAQMKAVLPRNHISILWAENLPLPELVTALAGCGQYLGHDTGITHLAASLQMPTLALFGRTDPVIWAPLGNHVQVLRAPAGNLALLSVDAVFRHAKNNVKDRRTT